MCKCPQPLFCSVFVNCTCSSVFRKSCFPISEPALSFLSFANARQPIKNPSIAGRVGLPAAQPRPTTSPTSAPRPPPPSPQNFWRVPIPHRRHLRHRPSRPYPSRRCSAGPQFSARAHLRTHLLPPAEFIKEVSAELPAIEIALANASTCAAESDVLCTCTSNSAPLRSSMAATCVPEPISIWSVPSARIPARWILTRSSDRASSSTPMALPYPKLESC